MVVAHPDDIDFGAGGTVATWVDAGIEVTYLLCTRGTPGGFDDTPRAEMPALREREQRAAAAEVGGAATSGSWTGYADGSLEPTLELVRDISRVIRQVRPRRLLTSSPERWWERLGPSTRTTWRPARRRPGRSTRPPRNPFAFPELLADEGLDAWTVPELWLMADAKSDHPVDITDDVRAQGGGAAGARQPDLAQRGPEAMLRTWSSGVAARLGLPDGRLAEAFRVVSIPDATPACRLAVELLFGRPRCRLTQEIGRITTVRRPNINRTARRVGVRGAGGRRPSGSARAGWRAGACAAPRTRGSRPSSPR